MAYTENICPFVLMQARQKLCYVKTTLVIVCVVLVRLKLINCKKWLVRSVDVKAELD